MIFSFWFIGIVKSSQGLTHERRCKTLMEVLDYGNQILLEHIKKHFDFQFLVLIGG
jgi:hypothetical protein